MIQDNPDQSVIDIAIIGGGITGLAAAFELQQWSEKNYPISFNLFEASFVVGGKIATDTVVIPEGQLLLEQGPDSFLIQKPWALELTNQLGLESELLETNSHQRRIFVFRKGRLLSMPDGMMFMIPTRFWPFIVTRVLSFCGKIRAAFELFIPRKKSKQDESVAYFVQRRFGKEVFNYIAEPLLAGIYNADAYRQSLMATFPQFAMMEEKHGSLIRAMLFLHRRTTKSPFMSFRNGMHTLIKALEQKLEGYLQKNTKIQFLSKTKEGYYKLVFENGRTQFARDILLATSAISCANLLSHISSQATACLRTLRMNTSGCIYFAFPKTDILHPLDGFGVTIPSSEKCIINAVTFVSTKLEHRAPDHIALLRVFFGGFRNPFIMTKSNEEIEQIARNELKHILGITKPPLFSKIYRNQHENPQYDVGHLQKIKELEEALPFDIQIAGCAYEGVGIPDCVEQGRRKAQKAIQAILKKTIKSLQK